MNICKFFLSIFFIFSENIQNISTANSSKTRFNFFHDNVQNIHDVMNNIFITGLKLHKNFTQSVKNRLLLTMHQDLVKIVTNNDKKEFENIADKPIVNDPYTNMLDEILQDETIFLPVNATEVYSKIIDIIDQNVLSNIHTYLKQLFLASDEPASDTETISNLDIRESTEREEPFLKKQNFSTRINLKAWVPEANSEESLYNRRLYGGKKTSIKKYPFVASVHVNNVFVCAGSIIGKGLVLTAASCLQATKFQRTHRPPADISVRLGGENTYDGAAISVAYVHFHPSYDAETLNNNLAILKMVKHKLIKKNSVRRIRYEQSYTPIRNDAIVTILGWGAQDERNVPDPSQRLSVARLAVYKKKDCVNVYSKYYVVDANFCAGYNDRGSGACNKDVGNPAVIEGTLIGVVSFGPPHCGSPDTPTVFTRIGVYANWLDTIIQLEVKNEHRKTTYENQKPEKPHRPQPPQSPHTGLRQEHYSHNNEYPEEIFILKEILNDITKSNNSLIENIIQDGFNKEMVSMIASKKDGRYSPSVASNDFPPNIKKSVIKPYFKPLTTKQSVRTDYTIDPNTKFALHNYIDLNAFSKFYDSLRHQNVDQSAEPTTRKNRIIKKTKIYQNNMAKQNQMPQDMVYYDQPVKSVRPNGPIQYYDQSMESQFTVLTTLEEPGPYFDQSKHEKGSYDLDDHYNNAKYDDDRVHITPAYKPGTYGPLDYDSPPHTSKKFKKYYTNEPGADQAHYIASQKLQYLPSRKSTMPTIALLPDNDEGFDNYETEVYEERGLSIEVNINTIRKTTPSSPNVFGRPTTNSNNLLFLIEADVGSDVKSQSKHAPDRSKYFQMNQKPREISVTKGMNLDSDSYVSEEHMQHMTKYSQNYVWA